MLRKILPVSALSAFLSGCIGSQLVVDDADTSATFPDIHSVPERPVLPERSKSTQTGEELTNLQQEAIDENLALRKKYGLK